MSSNICRSLLIS